MQNDVFVFVDQGNASQSVALGDGAHHLAVKPDNPVVVHFSRRWAWQLKAVGWYSVVARKRQALSTRIPVATVVIVVVVEVVII